MSTRRSVLLGLACAGGPWGVHPARASQDVSEWVETGHARVRLIDAGGAASARLAGLQIQLDPSYLTYWRTPGEAGVAPTFDFAGSVNLATAKVEYPSPKRFDEGGAVAFGYKDEVVFPIEVFAVDPHAPVTLAVSLAFAICSDLCLPANAATTLVLSGRGEGPEAGLVRDTVEHVPVPHSFGSAGILAVEEVTAGLARDRASVTVRAPPDKPPALFVEGPEPWYIEVGVAEAAGNGRFTFPLRVLAGSKQPATVALQLTLATDAAAIETAVQLDVAAPNP